MQDLSGNSHHKDPKSYQTKVKEAPLGMVSLHSFKSTKSNQIPHAQDVKTEDEDNLKSESVPENGKIVDNANTAPTKMVNK